MKKIIKDKDLPKEGNFFNWNIEKDDKVIFYIGTSDSISDNKKDIYNTNNNISTLISEKRDSKIIKIGVTKNIDTRLSYFHQEIPDFRILKSWEINNPTFLKEQLVDDNYDNGFESYGSTWFWGSDNSLKGLIENVEDYIENSYLQVKGGHILLFKD